MDSLRCYPKASLRRAGVSRTFVPWDAIEFVGIVEMYDQRMVAVRVTDPSAVESPGWARVFSRLNRSMLDADVFYAGLSVPEAELQAAIVDRLEHPEKRTRPEDP